VTGKKDGKYAFIEAGKTSFKWDGKKGGKGRKKREKGKKVTETKI
jgi:hypothetical protein